MRKKRAQAALEFLITYGWAFLLIIVMIAGLAHFGILDPGRFQSDYCIASNEIICTESDHGTDISEYAYYVIQTPRPIIIEGTSYDWDIEGTNDNCVNGELYLFKEDSGVALSMNFHPDRTAPVHYVPRKKNLDVTTTENQKIILRLNCQFNSKEIAIVKINLDYTPVGSLLTKILTIESKTSIT